MKSPAIKRPTVINSRHLHTILRLVSLLMIFGAVLLLVMQLVQYSRVRNTYPPGMVIAGVPAGGLSSSDAAARLARSFGLPIEIHYMDSIIQIKPSAAGFELDLASMLAAAELQRINQPFWSAFWDYLWDRLPAPREVPLRATISEQRLRSYLEHEIATRYDREPAAAMPVAGESTFSEGEYGAALDIDRAVVLVEAALRSPTQRVVKLSYSEVRPSRPTLENLDIMLRQIIEVSNFSGVAEVYLLDLATNEEISFALNDGVEVTPNIAFTAASTMKIPILISAYRRMSEPYRNEDLKNIQLMIERSENGPADDLMRSLLDTNLGPLSVTDDIHALGMKNTFLAGYFYPGATLLQAFKTPANQRTDVVVDRDVYNQTTPIEMGLMLKDIYDCAKFNGGSIPAVFGNDITQNECDAMLTALKTNRIGVLIQAGLPDGTPFAHKHGWITENDGMIHTIGDAGIVFSPENTYVISIFLYHPVQLIWDDANLLMAQLGTATYNYFNLPKQ